MRRAEVLLKDRPVGLLEELEGGYRFTYHRDYLKGPKPQPSTLINTEIDVAINIQIYDRSGKMLVDENFSDSKGLGGNFFVPELHARQSVLSETESILTKVFSSPKINNSL